MKTTFKFTTNSVSDSNLSFRNVDSQTEKQPQYAQFMDVHSWKFESETGEESKSKCTSEIGLYLLAFGKKSYPAKVSIWHIMK